MLQSLGVLKVLKCISYPLHAFNVFNSGSKPCSIFLRYCSFPFLLSLMPKGKGQAKPLKPSKAKAAGGPEDTASIVLLKLKAKAAAPKAKAKAKAAAPKAKAPSMKRPSTVTETSQPSTSTSGCESVKQWVSSYLHHSARHPQPSITT